MQSKCSQNAAKIQSKSVKIQSEFSQNSIKIQSNYSQSSVKIQPLFGAFSVFLIHFGHYSNQRVTFISCFSQCRPHFFTIFQFSWNQLFDLIWGLRGHLNNKGVSWGINEINLCYLKHDICRTQILGVLQKALTTGAHTLHIFNVLLHILHKFVIKWNTYQERKHFYKCFISFKAWVFHTVYLFS